MKYISIFFLILSHLFSLNLSVTYYVDGAAKGQFSNEIIKVEATSNNSLLFYSSLNSYYNFSSYCKQYTRNEMYYSSGYSLYECLSADRTLGKPYLSYYWKGTTDLLSPIVFPNKTFDLSQSYTAPIPPNPIIQSSTFKELGLTDTDLWFMFSLSGVLCAFVWSYSIARNL